MSNEDTAVLVGWPIANPAAFALQAGTPVPPPGVPSTSDPQTPGTPMLPVGTGNHGPIFPTSGLK